MSSQGDKKPQYYFNTRTGEVEEGPQSSWENRMGPYDTREEATKALETARKRTQAWDEADEEWRQG
ncbi:hypothetical protein [Demequina globuliformis]|uniref:hypothetical protein n=1 Tax=Demequina globuliformis TaxID=676202 RepID=UPI000781B7AA|nr:hypothetical protein [Demequina globuliformis]